MQARNGWRPSGRLLVTPSHHLKDGQILSNLWGPPHLRFGRVLYDRLRAVALHEVLANEQPSMGEGGSVEASPLRSNYDQLRDVMIEGGHITTEELEEDLTRFGRSCVPEPDAAAVRLGPPAI